ncbi:RNA-directed DNA polymerase [Lysinibacillus sphaericus]|uniref:RNA-directed DNA polymerase n=1 Tax=Lysinibacillus sphaericus TaxID=1421 RepID=A0A544UGB3_LYSSH|nr:RNA-directed DNA polymerase [Lysinibacillus sp. SDF0037]TQR31725.1 RNA-directed DNA polymerase [Lysinibacillus sp. SDF0037]
MREQLFFKTDTLPAEIPILFNNKNLYSNFTKKYFSDLYLTDEKYQSLFSFITVPYHFYVPKDEYNNRKLSLLHPIAQLQMFSYILRYEQLIVAFSNESRFSVRSPIIRNQPVFKPKDIHKTWKRLDEEFSFSKENSVTSEEDEKYFNSYFSYKSFKNIQNLYTSPKFNRVKYKFNYFIKLDLQNFFPSIYTHSIAWAILGDKSLAKKLRNEKDLFANATDIICQRINFNETNGIVVGPEFSRIVSELLLTRIDSTLYNNLHELNYFFNKDYVLYRYIDDYFLFAENKEIATKIENVMKLELDNFNLKLNESKKNIQEKPFDMLDHSIIELKNAFSLFNFNLLRFENAGLKSKTWLDNIWKDLFNNIELIITKYPHSKEKTIKYFLKKVRNSIPINYEINLFSLTNIVEIISQLYSLGINSYSTDYLIAIYTKIIQTLKKDKENHEDFFNFINEKIYQYCFTLLKNNFDKIHTMYDLIIFIKFLDKKIPSTFLIKILEANTKNYFVLCSVGYYILNDNLTGINTQYLTVIKKLRKIIITFKNEYIGKGADSSILEAGYFYIINDFSYYPGFRPSDRNKLKKQLNREINQLTLTIKGNIQLQNVYKDIFTKITSSSYYDWNKDITSFLREAAKKSINIPRSQFPIYS